MVTQYVGPAAIDVGTRPAQPHIVRLAWRDRPVGERLVAPPERDEFVFPKEGYGDGRALPSCGMFDYYKSSRGDASPGATLDRQLLRGELDHIGRVRLSMEAALELGEYESAVRGPVGAIDLDTEPEWPPGMEHALRELDSSVLQLLRQPRPLPDLEPPSTRDDP